MPKSGYALRVIAVTIPIVSVVMFRQFSISSSHGNPTTIDGIMFAPTLQMNGATQRFFGGGTRYKFNVVKVYAAGLYVDADGAALLKACAGKSAVELTKTSSFYDKLVVGKFGKTLLLQFHRSVSTTAMADAMRDSLSKKLEKNSLKKFTQALAQVKLKRSSNHCRKKVNGVHTDAHNNGNGLVIAPFRLHTDT